MINVRKATKRLKRRLLRKKSKVFFVTCLLVVVVLSAILYSSAMPKYIDPSTYRVLLNVIAGGESNGNYNAYFGHPTNTSLELTDMTIAEVLHWQEDYINSGNASNAAGRYQIIQPTLEGLVRELDVDPSEIFNETLQDKMAITLAEGRGARDFVEEKITTEQFAANLAKEWAALPSVTGEKPSESFYAGDGLNQSRIPVNTILNAVNEFKRAAQ